MIQEKIFQKINQLNVYFVTDPENVKKGYQYFIEKRVCSFKWEDNTLKAAVLGLCLNTVKIFLDKEELVFDCDCTSFSKKKLCIHVIATIFTIRTLLKSNVNEIKQEGMIKVLDELFSFNREFEPEKTKKFGFIIIDYDKNDIVFELPSRIRVNYDVPKDFFDLFKIIKEGYYSPADLLDKNFFPVFFIYKNKSIDVRYEHSLRFKTFLSIKIKKEDVLFTIIAVNQKNRETKFLVKDFAIHPEEKIFGLVRNLEAKKTFQAIMRQLDNYFIYEVIPNEFAVSADWIKGKIFHLDEKHINNIRFEDPFVFLKPSLLIDITFRKGEVTIIPYIFIDGEKVPFEKEFLNIWLKLLRGSLSYLRKFSTRHYIINSIIEEFNKEFSQDTVARIINKFDGSFTELEQMEDFLKFLYKFNNSLKNSITLIKDRWVSFNLSLQERISIIEVLYKTFGESLFRQTSRSDEYIVFKIKEDDFKTKISQLKIFSNLRNIEIRINNKPLKTYSLDISIEVQKNIDWFELHPQIIKDGIKISDKLWKSIISGSGYIDTGESIEIPDAQTQDKIVSIIKLISFRDKKNKKSDIIELPRLQIFDWIELRKKGVKLNIPPEDEKIINNLLNFQSIENKPLPEGLKAKLRDYQYKAYNWLCFLYEHKLGGCLADDMGLGKTLQTIALLSAIKEGIIGQKSITSPHLIVVPSTLLFNWEMEIQRFYPDMRIYQYTDINRKNSFDNCDIILTTYDILKRDIALLNKKLFHVIVFDEAQNVKNIHAQRTLAVRQLKGYFKLALTGTPLENHLGEYYSVIDLVLPGLLGNYRDFKNLMSSNKIDSLDFLIKRTKPFVLRRTKEEVLKEIPPKIENDIYLELTEKQKAIYTKTVKEVKKTIEDAYERRNSGEVKIVVLSALLKLRQICLSPKLLSSELPENSPKIDFLIERVKVLIDEGHSILIFSQFTSFLDIVEKRMGNEGLSFLRLDGSTPVKARKHIVESFQNGTYKIFLLSLKTGGQGLNLTKASYLFLLDPWWNPAVELQATDRAHRIGQRNKVNVMKLIMRHTIEEKIMLLKARKKALYDALLGNLGITKAFNITKEDIDFLLNWNI